MRILLIRLSSFGDVLLTTPAIDALAERYPDAKIDIATYSHFGAALSQHPRVDRLLLVPKKAMKQSLASWSVGHAVSEFGRFVQALRQHRYDWIVDLHNVFDSALIALMARGGRRVGNRRQALSIGYSVRCGFDDGNETASEHAALSNLRYLTEAGCLPEESLRAEPRLSFFTPETAKQSINHYLSEQGLLDRPLLGLNPGGSYEYKRWQPERFAQVGDSVHERWGLPVLLFGGPAERVAVKRVADAMRCPTINTAELPLFEAFELISRLRLFVTNDSAPLHVAAAAGTPTVGLYGPANYRKFSPLSDSIRPVLVDVPCRPCTPTTGRACAHRDCFSKMTVQQVCEACALHLQAEPQRRAS